MTDDDIIINDPEGEYSPLVKRLKGQVIKISPNSDQYVNPMDINANYSEEDNPLALKADFILSLCELVVGGKDGLMPVEKTVIDRCVHLIYCKYFADPCPENMPLLEDLYNALLQQEEKEAHHVATALEIYVKGSLNLFNHRTNVDIDNRIVCYDIKELGKQMKKLGMLVIQDQVWGRVTANRTAGKSTRYYADEFHLLLKEEQTAAYSVEIWKRFRKWGGIPTGLTQNVKDLLSSREVENVFENSDMIIMLNQAAGDRQILAKQLNISPHQLSYVTHSGEGEGLLFFGNVILPFVDRFPTDLELYRIMTTSWARFRRVRRNEQSETELQRGNVRKKDPFTPGESKCRADAAQKRKKLKLDTDKAKEKAQHLRFGKAELTPDDLRRLSKEQKREMYAAALARSAAHREIDQYEEDNVGVQALSEGEKSRRECSGLFQEPLLPEAEKESQDASKEKSPHHKIFYPPARQGTKCRRFQHPHGDSNEGGSNWLSRWKQRQEIRRATMPLPGRAVRRRRPLAAKRLHPAAHLQHGLAWSR